MCNFTANNNAEGRAGLKTRPVSESVGTILAHDITEIRPGEFKGRAFKKGHVIRKEDIPHLQRLGKNNLYVLEINDDEMHENDAAYALAESIAGDGVKMAGEPVEGKINLIAEQTGLLKVNTMALADLNMLGDVMCATLHNNFVVAKDQVVAGTRAIPLVVKKDVISRAVKIANDSKGIISIRKLKNARTGVVITGNEVYSGRIKDAFEPVIRKKVNALGCEITGVSFAPDNAGIIEQKIREHINNNADIVITTGGMSVDPDDVTRYAIRNLGAAEFIYGSPVLPGAMFLIAYVRVKSQDLMVKSENRAECNAPDSKLIPVIGIPACGMYASVTVFDLILPRILAGEKISRRDIAELGHGGLCMKCKECRYPVCPFGK